MKFDLVFEGGGAKGMVFVGALQAFEARGNTPGRLLGTSAGAITAALLAVGYDSQEMLVALGEQKEGHSVFMDFMGTPAPFPEKDLRDNDILTLLMQVKLPLAPLAAAGKFDDQVVRWLAKQPRFRHIFSFVQCGGWYSADNFLTWIQARLDSGTYREKPRHFSQMSLEELFAATGVELTVIASDTTGGMMLVLNHHTAPECPLVWAVRMSMSIPLLWQEVIWQPEWGLYRGQDLSGHTVVDGGLLSNFPIELFLSDSKDVTDVMGPKGSEPVMGLLIDETLPVKGTEQPEAQNAGLELGELHTVQRLTNLVNTVLSARDKMVIEAYENLVVHLPAQGYGTTEFNMSALRRELLITAGRETMSQYLAQRERPVPSRPQAETQRIAQANDRSAGRIMSRSNRQKDIPI